MKNSVPLEPPADDADAMEAAISRLIEQMDEIRLQMMQDQADIEQMKAESRVLKAKRDLLKAQTRALLATLRE